MPDDYTASELLAVMSSRLLKDGQIVFAGVGIPLLAATLAQGLHCPGLTILFEGGVIGPVIAAPAFDTEEPAALVEVLGVKLAARDGVGVEELALKEGPGWRR